MREEKIEGSYSTGFSNGGSVCSISKRNGLEAGQPKILFSQSSSKTHKSLKMCFDPVIMHTLALIKFRKEMKHCVTAAQSTAVPEQTGKKPVLFSPMLRENESVKGKFSRKAIARSVLILGAHIGFQEIETSAVIMLSSVVMTYLQRIWRIMRLCDERRSCGRSSAFVCSFLQVLRLLRIEEVKDIGEFYLRRVIMRRNSLYALCMKEHQLLTEVRKGKKRREADLTHEGCQERVAKTSNQKRKKVIDYCSSDEGTIMKKSAVFGMFEE